MPYDILDGKLAEIIMAVAGAFCILFFKLLKSQKETFDNKISSLKEASDKQSKVFDKDIELIRDSINHQHDDISDIKKRIRSINNEH
jgi:hypothetical protein